MSFPRLDLTIKIQACRLRELLKWRVYLNALVESAIEVFGRDVEVYLFGSAVEGRLTVDSDIDVAVVLREVPKKGLERARLVDIPMEGYGVKGCTMVVSIRNTLVNQRGINTTQRHKVNQDILVHSPNSDLLPP